MFFLYINFVGLCTLFIHFKKVFESTHLKPGHWYILMTRKYVTYHISQANLIIHFDYAFDCKKLFYIFQSSLMIQYDDAFDFK